MTQSSKEEKLFVTMFFECSNIELVKDVAQIPWVLGNKYGLNTLLVSSNIDKTGAGLSNVPGLNIEIFPMVFNNSKITGFWYILKNAKKINWLNIYHCDRKSLYWALFFKFLNSSGKVYLKLDADFRNCEMIQQYPEKRKTFQKCMSVMDLVSVESEAVKNCLQKYTNKEIALIQNGYCESNNSSLETEKENIFLTVGRLGTKQKATDVLLQAFVKVAEKTDWKLRLVGKVEEGFEEYIAEYFKKNPELQSRVEFVGLITNRDELNNEYKRAKVFVLPSRWESFGLVLPEAMSNGCRLLATKEVPPIKEMTSQGKYGKIVPADDVRALEEAMIEITNDNYSEEYILEISEYAKKNYSWDAICDRLYNILTK